VLAYPNRTFKAKVTYIAPVLDPNTQRRTVRAETQNPDRELPPEMFASFRIISGEQRLMPAVPQDAVIYKGANARVWVADLAQKSVVVRSIEVGATANGVEVRGGSACLNSLRLWIGGSPPVFSRQSDARLGCNGGRA